MKVFITFMLACTAVIYSEATQKTYSRDQAYDGYRSQHTSYVHGNYGHEQNEYNKGKSQGGDYNLANSKFTYQGKYEGHCGNDGFYYNDHGSFVICSNNNAYVQPCAPGSRNSGFEKYNFGDNYNYRDFCDINLVDHGYGVKSAPNAKSYGHVESVKTHDHYGKDIPYNAKHPNEVAYNQQYIYHGKYEGHCGQDGFYYNDHGSFVICSNNNAYVQPCAPGSRNSGFDNYNFGDNYYYRDFCDINLVDQGYGVKDQYGHGHHNQKGY